MTTTTAPPTENTLICWHDDRADWGHLDTCPARDGDHIIWGRCRTGRRWFWAAFVAGYDLSRRAHGWADTEDDAIADARTSAADLVDGLPASASTSHGYASQRLKEINAGKRRARPSNGGTDTGVVEYLYGTYTAEDADGFIRTRVESFRITKKTASRIYYIRRHYLGDDPEIGFISRQRLENNGEAENHGRHWHESDRILYASPPDLSRTTKPTPAEAKAELSRLRKEMAEAHPDRGGTNAEFIAARQRYKQAVARAAATPGSPA